GSADELDGDIAHAGSALAGRVLHMHAVFHDVDHAAGRDDLLLGVDEGDRVAVAEVLNGDIRDRHQLGAGQFGIDVADARVGVDGLVGGPNPGDGLEASCRLGDRLVVGGRGGGAAADEGSSQRNGDEAGDDHLGSLALESTGRAGDSSQVSVHRYKTQLADFVQLPK